jgi:hypothetical protein
LSLWLSIVAPPSTLLLFSGRLSIVRCLLAAAHAQRQASGRKTPSTVLEHGLVFSLLKRRRRINGHHNDLVKGQDSGRRGKLDNRQFWPWRMGGRGVIILLCRLDIALLPVPLLQNPVAVCDRHNSRERRDNGCIIEGFSPCFAS